MYFFTIFSVLVDRFNMRRALNTKGQATVEAILMLVLGVSMVIGLMAGFSKTFSQFTDIYFGRYFKCLIENGELPRLKYVDGQSKCKVKNFSWSKGWEQNSKSSGKNSKNSSSSSSSNNSNNKKSTRGTSGGSSSSSSNSYRFVANPSGRGSNSGGGKAGVKKSSKTKKDSDNFGGQAVGISGSSYNSSDNAVQIIRIKRSANSGTGLSHDLYKDPGDKKIKITGRLKKTGEQGFAGKNNTHLKVDRTVAKIRVKKDTGFKFNFSSIMRFLIIAALIILIIIVIGGQLLSISKSFE